MGGLLEPFSDSMRGFKLFKPSGWNEFDGNGAEYDRRWIDLVERGDIITVSTSPVKSTTTIDLLGSSTAVGEKLAGGRGAKLLKASKRNTAGQDYYDIELAVDGGGHETITLCINKSKLWQLSCKSASEKKWNKRQKLYENAALSFLPRL